MIDKPIKLNLGSLDFLFLLLLYISGNLVRFLFLNIIIDVMDESGKTKQIQSFRETFRLIDKNNDGKLNDSDIKDTLSEIGVEYNDNLLLQLLNDKEEINQSTFISNFNNKFELFDKKQELLDAFDSFDIEQNGTIDIKSLNEFIDVSKISINKYTTKNNNFNYKDFLNDLFSY